MISGLPELVASITTADPNSEYAVVGSLIKEKGKGWFQWQLIHSHWIN